VTFRRKALDYLEIMGMFAEKTALPYFVLRLIYRNCLFFKENVVTL